MKTLSLDIIKLVDVYSSGRIKKLSILFNELDFNFLDFFNNESEEMKQKVRGFSKLHDTDLLVGYQMTNSINQILVTCDNNIKYINNNFLETLELVFNCKYLKNTSYLEASLKLLDLVEKSKFDNIKFIKIKIFDILDPIFYEKLGSSIKCENVEIIFMCDNIITPKIFNIRCEKLKIIFFENEEVIFEEENNSIKNLILLNCKINSSLEYFPNLNYLKTNLQYIEKLPENLTLIFEGNDLDQNSIRAKNIKLVENKPNKPEIIKKINTFISKLKYKKLSLVIKTHITNEFNLSETFENLELNLLTDKLETCKYLENNIIRSKSLKIYLKVGIFRIKLNVEVETLILIFDTYNDTLFNEFVIIPQKVLKVIKLIFMRKNIYSKIEEFKEKLEKMTKCLIKIE